MKMLARFEGKVNKFNPLPELSYITLKDVSTGNVVDTPAISTQLEAAGVGYDGAFFEVVINQSVDGSTTANILKVEPKTITPERAEEIHKEFEGRWTFDQPTNQQEKPLTLEDRLAALELRVQKLEDEQENYKKKWAEAVRDMNAINGCWEKKLEAINTKNNTSTLDK